MSVIHIDSKAVQKIQRFLTQKKQAGCVRVEIRSSGCCDAALALVVQDALETDIVEQYNGLHIALPVEIHQVVGSITISSSDDDASDDFFLTSEKPFSEWSGFAPCSIYMD